MTDKRETGGDGVGYGKPPKAHRFQKGQSGNPAGRKKKVKVKATKQALNKIIAEEMYRDIEVNDGGTLIVIPVIQALIRATLLQGIKGKASYRALMHVLDAVQNGLVDEMPDPEVIARMTPEDAIAVYRRHMEAK